jgi:hypothetical protein
MIDMHLLTWVGFGLDRVCLVWCPGQNKRIAPLSFLHGIKGLIALTPEIDCNKTAMGLPPVTSGVFFTANSFW